MENAADKAVILTLEQVLRNRPSFIVKDGVGMTTSETSLPSL
jgi:hypothetical protein